MYTVCLDLHSNQFARLKEKLEGTVIKRVEYNPSSGEVIIITQSGELTLMLFSERYVEWCATDSHKMEEEAD